MHISQDNFTINNTHQNISHSSHHLISIPKNNCYYNLNSTQSITDQNLFLVPLLKIFSAKLPMNLLCTIINTSPNNDILLRNRHIGKMTHLNCSNTPIHPVSVNEIKYGIKPKTINANWTPFNDKP